MKRRLHSSWVWAIFAISSAGVSCAVPEASGKTRYPAVEPPSTLRPPRPEQRTVVGKMKLLHVSRQDVPLVSLALLVAYGAAEDPAGKAGLAALTATMLDEGAGARGALSLADELDYLGADLTISAERESSVVRLEVLRENLEPALDILADVVVRPHFEQKEWKRVRALWINDLRQDMENPGRVAGVVGSRIFFGDDHAYGRPVSGFLESVESISIQDVRAFHSRHWRPDATTLISAGSISTAEIASLLEARLKSWKADGEPPVPTRITTVPAGNHPRVVLVDKPRSAQTVIRVVGSGISRTAPDYLALSLANVIFGGSFTSRLNQNLRESHGYTYGAGSNFSRLRGPGLFISVSAVRADVTAESITEFAREYGRIRRDGIDEHEVARARATIRQSFVESLESLAGTVQLFTSLARTGLPPDEVPRMLGELPTTGADTVTAAARRSIRWDDAIMVLVGDRATIAREIDGLDLGTVLVVDAQGNPLTK